MEVLSYREPVWFSPQEKLRGWFSAQHILGDACCFWHSFPRQSWVISGILKMAILVWFYPLPLLDFLPCNRACFSMYLNIKHCCWGSQRVAPSGSAIQWTLLFLLTWDRVKNRWSFILLLFLLLFGLLVLWVAQTQFLPSSDVEVCISIRKQQDPWVVPVHATAVYTVPAGCEWRLSMLEAVPQGYSLSLL